MGGQQRIYKEKIRSTETLGKVFRAMEMIAASRIGAARRRATESNPYTTALTNAVAAVTAHAKADHPLTRARTDTNRVAVLAVASDRGLAGAYSATILRETERLLQELREEGKEPVLYTTGRRARHFFNFREIPIQRSWEGGSDSPSRETITEVSDELLSAFLDPDPQVGVGEIYLVFTRFRSMIKQVPEIRKMLPLTVVAATEELGDDVPVSQAQAGGLFPQYEYIPDAETVLGALLPLYVGDRIGTALIQSAASELAARQQAMHSATDNANDLIFNYTRLANAARQAEITQEISEIVSGADALTQQA